MSCSEATIRSSDLKWLLVISDAHSSAYKAKTSVSKFGKFGHSKGVMTQMVSGFFYLKFWSNFEIDQEVAP
jgi:hypothetical protein